MKKHALIALFLTLSSTTPTWAQSVDEPVGVKRHAEEGIYLVAGNGFAIYLFKADTQGKRDGAGAVSACDGDCIGLWPPVIVEDEPVGGEGVEAALLGTMTRSDGLMQLTYNGWPLYFYGEDVTPEDIKGHDLESFGEDWYLIGPHGERAED